MTQRTPETRTRCNTRACCCRALQVLVNPLMITAYLREPKVRLALSALGIVSLAVLATRAVSGSGVGEALANPTAPGGPVAEVVNRPSVRHVALGDAARMLAFDSLMGRSERVYVRLLPRDEVDFYPVLVDRFGEEARRPGVRAFSDAPGGVTFSFITLRPWSEKRGNSLNGYRLGWWPAERQAMPTNYDNPGGFVEVTLANAGTSLSKHFHLGDFVTHDQMSVWPKYVVLREELLDKLELVLETLQAQGVPTQRAAILSGFRSPQYNQSGWSEGMAYASRHQYGDAADLIIDSNGDGRMDDLNRDGVVDFRDTDVINAAVERVERRFPELVGGLGLYRAMGPSGPFAHIDVRGTRARWTNSASRRGGSSRLEYAAPAAPGNARCQAEGAMAVLCVGVK